MAIRQDFLEALSQLSRVAKHYKSTTGSDLILVGGAATAILTEGSFNSNDFDIIAYSDDKFNESMLSYGFINEDRKGKLIIGWYHPNHSNYGFQLVTPPLFDGNTQEDKILTFSVLEDEKTEIKIPPIEDMIADRLGQHAISSPTDDSRLEQAKMIFKLSSRKLDLNYLKKRIIEEDGDFNLLGIN